MKTFPKFPLPTLPQIFPNASDEAADLLLRLLQFNPKKRLSADEALRHPFVAQFHNPSDEPGCSRVIAIPIDDNTKYSIAEYRDKLYAEIVKRKKELRKKIKEREARQLADQLERTHVTDATPSPGPSSNSVRDDAFFLLLLSIAYL